MAEMPSAQPPASPDAVLRIDGTETADAAVSVEVLVRALNGMQQTAYLLAAAESRQPVRERFRPSAELRERATLRCAVPRAGSFAVPLRMPGEQLGIDLQGTGRRIGLLDAIYDLLVAVAHEAIEQVEALLPDTSLRWRAMRELQRMLPRAGERWTIGFSSHGRPEVRLDDRAARMLAGWSAERLPEDTVMTVTGDLVRIDFEAHKIVLRYRPTGRSIECFYRPEIEDMLLGVRHEPIQVTGVFTLDDEGHPERLADVSSIQPVDLRPMTFERVEYGGRAFAFGPPLALAPVLDDDAGQLYVLADGRLGIHVFAQTREQLAVELAEQVAFLWDEYALEDPARLTSEAQAIREALRARVKELTDAEG